MASVQNGKKGWTVQFTNPQGKRKTISLGRVAEREAERFGRNVEKLIGAAGMSCAPDGDVIGWVAGLGESLRKKLAKAGLIEKPTDSTTAPMSKNLGAFIDEYISGRIDVKPGTAEIYQQIRRNLVEYFGEDKPLGDINPGDAEDFRLDLIRQKRADATIRRRCGLAKQLFRKAVKLRLIDSNPFEDIVSTSRGNRERFYFVSRNEIDLVLAKCPDAQWKLLVALSRFGGLRCPSEHLALRWGDIDWEKSRIRVPSPKTEHHEGKAERIIPLFPELLPYLRAVYEEAEPGTEFVITRYRDTRTNLRTHFMRIISKAGLTPWPKPWQNLRSTRQTELAETFPAHVVCRWIGNTLEVADEHYLQVTDAHFDRAVKALQKVALNDSESEGTRENAPGPNRDSDTKNAVSACHEDVKAGPQGFEP
ncbi:MAG: site-specific integrase [Planctomycetota bacterium]